MKPIKIAFAGAGGYADYCLGLLLDFVPQEEYELVGIADPFAKNAPRAAFFEQNGIPLFDSVEELLETQSVDALYVASPINFHKQQCEAAMRHGCAVLCEKPLTATYADTQALRAQAQQSRQPFGVGFQWSFAQSMLQAKQDILQKRYGKPLSLKVYISWQRFDDYYQNSTWKGRITDRHGNRINDSVVTNATAHYLHNMFFLMGNALDESEMPVAVKGSVYRAKPIESFDTCFLKGSFQNGATFLFLSTHSGNQNTNPIVEYTFEKGSIRIDTNTDSPVVRGLVDGEEISYGTISTRESDSDKVKAFLKSIREGTALTCPIDAVLPHQAVCNAIFEQLPILEFPPSLVYREEERKGWLVNDLCKDLERCFETLQTPEEAGCHWAKPDQALTLPFGI